MKTITVNVPQSLGDITLEQFQRVAMLSAEEDFDVKAQAYCSIIYQMPGNIVQRTPRKVLKELVEKVDEIMNYQPALVNRFILHEKEYGLIPDFDRITAGEWVDMETRGFSPENLHKLMAILYRPVTESKGEKYIIATYTGEEPSEQFKDTPAVIMVSALLFFYRIVLDCTTAIPNLIGTTRKRIRRGGSLAPVGAGTAL